MEFGHARAIARTAYIFTYPLVMSYGDLYVRVAGAAAPTHSGGFETWLMGSARPSEEDARSGERLQASAWVDLRTGPRTVTLGHHQVRLGVTDLWGFDVARWTGDVSHPTQAILLVAPTWMGEVTQDDDHVVRGESPFLRIEVTTQQQGSAEGLTFAELERAVVLSSPGGDDGRPSLEPPLGLDWVPWSAGDAVTNHFWSCANFALSLIEPHVDDQRVLDRIGEIGVIPGEPWDAGWFSSDVLEAISAGMDQALSDLLAATAGTVDQERLECSRAEFDHDYFGRALRILAHPRLSRAPFPGR
jgi:hypothetical protein